MAAAGGSGMFLSKSRKGRLVDGKKKRMPFIAANGLVVLVPCAIALNRLLHLSRVGDAVDRMRSD